MGVQLQEFSVACWKYSSLEKYKLESSRNLDGHASLGCLAAWHDVLASALRSLHLALT